MSEITQYKPGNFCWVELSTFDTNAAKKFYSELFGISPYDMDMGNGSYYTMLNLRDKPVAALYNMSPEQREMHFASCWMPYINVTSVAETIAKVKQAGGLVLVDTTDAMDAGVFGMIQDTEGAMVGLWQPKNHAGSAFIGEHGTICWFEHNGHTTDKVIPFLENVFGWKAKTEKMGETNYTTFYQGEEMVCGFFVLPPEMKDVPPSWLTYFGVNNIDEACEKVIKLKGQIIMPKIFIEGVGFYGVVRDDQGAVFGLLQGQM